MQERDIVNRYHQAIIVILLPICFVIGLTRSLNMRYAFKEREVLGITRLA